ncbi:MAG: tRNA 2-thiouridine(34) synthase MnmA [Lachnospiraceae bacterium]|nr:tRNA 2-thiouridine(34) synthase MnmA [Lachnospiraceae bacterium]
MNKALIAMSGGVDSSVAAYLMKKEGYECIGVTMKLYDNDDIGMEREKTCCSLSDVEDARGVAIKVGIPYYVFNFKGDFEKKVIDRFIKIYREGGTPNPCVDCNKYMKFDALMNRMEELDYDYVVTGHYARVGFDEASGRYLLKKGLDVSKDQSYVLYNLDQNQLSHVKFPLGDYKKSEIREIAEEQGFLNAEKKDSQDICFVPDGDYAGFIESHTGIKDPEGDFVLKDGTVVGRHKGQIRYTIGQRRGLGIAWTESLYVTEKDIKNNRVILGYNDDLFSDTLFAEDINLISVEKITEPIRCTAKIRYKAKEAPCTVTQTLDDEIKVVFDEPQRGITTGQSVVLYDGDIVIGGGIIK